MEKEKELSNKKSEDIQFAALGDNERVYLQKNGIGDTDDSFKYEWKDINCKILAIFESSTRKWIDSVSCDNNGLIGVILDRSAYYAESGGQVCDIGYIIGIDDDNKNNDNNDNE